MENQNTTSQPVVNKKDPVSPFMMGMFTALAYVIIMSIAYAVGFPIGETMFSFFVSPASPFINAIFPEGFRDVAAMAVYVLVNAIVYFIIAYTVGKLMYRPAQDAVVMQGDGSISHAGRDVFLGFLSGIAIVIVGTSFVVAAVALFVGVILSFIPKLRMFGCGVMLGVIIVPLAFFGFCLLTIYSAGYNHY